MSLTRNTKMMMSAAMILAAAGAPAGAQTVRAWRGDVGNATLDGAFGNPLHWTPAGAPQAFDTAVIDASSAMAYAIDLSEDRVLWSLDVASPMATLAIGAPSGDLTLETQSDLDNAGDILVNAGSGIASIDVSGTLSNSGLIEFSWTSSGGCRVYGEVVNEPTGVMYVRERTEFRRGTFTNQGGISLTDNLLSYGDFVHESGAIDTGNARLISGEGVFRYLGGEITGDHPIRVGALEVAPGTGPARFEFMFCCNELLTGLEPGQEVVLSGAELTITDSVTNAGSIRLEMESLQLPELTVLPGEVLTNTGTITFAPADGNGHEFSGAVVNETTGLIVVQYRTVTDSAPMTNRGEIVLYDNLLAFGDFVQEGGLLNTRNRRLFANDGTFQYRAGQITGDHPVVVRTLEIGPGAGPAAFEFRFCCGSITGNIGSGQRIELDGAEVTASSGFVNAGDIVFDSSTVGGSSELVIPEGGVLTNSGRIITGTGTGAHRIVGRVTNDGLVSIQHETEAPDGLVSSPIGVLEGDAIVTFDGASMTNSGTIAPGVSGGDETGTLTLGGELFGTAFANYEFGLGGTDAGESDRLVVGGALTLQGGGLRVSAVDGFTPRSGDEFLIVEVQGGRTGAFAMANEGDVVATISGVELVISYAGGDGDDIVLTAVGDACPADLAEPIGVLDFSDVLAFLTAFGGGEVAADLAEPFGVFNFSDVIAFLTSFGAGCP